MCVTAIWHPRRPRKFLIKFSLLPRGRPDRGGRAETLSEFFHPCGSCESSRETGKPILPPSSPPPLSTSTWQLQITFGSSRGEAFSPQSELYSNLPQPSREQRKIIKLATIGVGSGDIYLDLSIPFSLLALFKAGAVSFL